MNRWIFALVLILVLSTGAQAICIPIGGTNSDGGATGGLTCKYGRGGTHPVSTSGYSQKIENGQVRWGHGTARSTGVDGWLVFYEAGSNDKEFGIHNFLLELKDEGTQKVAYLRYQVDSNEGAGSEDGEVLTVFLRDAQGKHLAELGPSPWDAVCADSDRDTVWGPYRYVISDEAFANAVDAYLPPLSSLAHGC